MENISITKISCLELTNLIKSVNPNLEKVVFDNTGKVLQSDTIFVLFKTKSSEKLLEVCEHLRKTLNKNLLFSSVAVNEESAIYDYHMAYSVYDSIIDAPTKEINIPIKISFNEIGFFDNDI